MKVVRNQDAHWPSFHLALTSISHLYSSQHSYWQLVDSFSPWPKLATQVPFLTDWVRFVSAWLLTPVANLEGCFNQAADARRSTPQTGYEVTTKIGMQSRGFRITLAGRPQEGPCRLKRKSLGWLFQFCNEEWSGSPLTNYQALATDI